MSVAIGDGESHDSFSCYNMNYQVLATLRRGCYQHLSYLNLSTNNKPIKLVFIIVVNDNYLMLLGNGTTMYQESQLLKYVNVCYHG